MDHEPWFTTRNLIITLLILQIWELIIDLYPYATRLF